MNPHESQESTEQKKETLKSTKNKKSSQRTTIKKSSKIENKLSSEKQSSFKTSRKETNINVENPPNDNQIKHYDNIGKQGMNYRVEIYKTKENVSRLEKDLEIKNKKLEKVIKEKQNFQNYLSKLEKIVQEKTDTDNQEQKVNIPPSQRSQQESSANKTISNKDDQSQSNAEQTEENNKVKLTINMTGVAPVITMDDGQGNKNVIKSKKGLMKFLYKIYSENQNLKNFQKQVFDLSKDYEDINNIMKEGISGFQEIAKGTKNEKIQNLVDEKLKGLKSEIEASLEHKQKEYNEQLKKKDEEINMLTKAYENIYKEVQQKNSDKIHEQTTIKNLNSQIEILETKLAYLKQNH